MMTDRSPSTADLLIALNLSALPRAAVCAFGRKSELWREGPRIGLSATARELGVTRPQLAAALDVRREAARVAAAARRDAAAVGASIVTSADPDYPRSLDDLSLPPPVLYVRGRLPRRPAMAIVGSRRATGYGKEAARCFGRELAARGLTVVSGFARGVDAEAHRGALEAVDGRTVAVLGCGIDVDYPQGRRRLRREIAERGALVSEFPPGAPPHRAHFPIRNRIIAALAACTLVVEGAERSGSLITARLALDLGRDLAAVPGRIFDRLAVGPNALIRDGAVPALTPRDLIEALPWAERERLPEIDGASPADRDDGPLMALLRREALLTPEELVAQTGLPIDAVLADLLELELAGNVRRHAGGRYVAAGSRS